MAKILGSKRNFVTTIVSLCVCFCILIVGVICFYLFMGNKDYKLYQSKIIGEQYQMLYEQERVTIASLEPLMNSSMKDILSDLTRRVRAGEDLSQANLQHLSQLKMVTGIWVIEQDKLVRISSDGSSSDASGWHRDLSQSEWTEKLDSMLRSPGESYIGAFTKNEKYPHEYVKWGFMGMGYVPQLGGNAVLEIGVGIENAYTIGRIESTVEKTSSAIKNIVSTEFVRSAPGAPVLGENLAKEIKEKTYQRLKRDGNVEVSLMAKDFNDNYTQIIITTTFPKTDRENLALGLIAAAATVFMLLCLLLVIRVTRVEKRQ